MTDYLALRAINEADLKERMRAICSDALDEISREIDRFDRKYGVGTVLEDAALYRYKRLQMLSDAVNKVIRDLTPEMADMVYSFAEESYVTGYYWNTFVADMTVPFAVNFAGVNERLLRASVDRKIVGLTLKDRLSSRRFMRLWDERDAVAKAQILGYGERKTANEIIKTWGPKDALKKDILEKVDRTYADAVRIARTESCRNATEAANHANFDMMRDNEIDVRNVWLSSHDERTRSSHRVLDGKCADIWSDKYQMYCFSHNGIVSPGPGRWNDPGMNINCRCSMSSRVMGYEDFEAKYEDFYGWLDRIKDDPRYADTVATIRKGETVAA